MEAGQREGIAQGRNVEDLLDEAVEANIDSKRAGAGREISDVAEIGFEYTILAVSHFCSGYLPGDFAQRVSWREKRTLHRRLGSIGALLWS